MAAASLRIEIAVTAQEARELLAKAQHLLTPNQIFAKAIWLGMQKLVLKAQRERFSGKGPFPPAQNRLGIGRNPGGRLRASLYARETELTSDGYLSKIGSNVEYFGAHEFGFSGSVPVKAHQRQAYTVNRRKSTRTNAAGRPVTIRANQYSVLPGTVRAHTRNLNIPERKPMRTAIDDHAERILTASIRSAIRTALKS